MEFQKLEIPYRRIKGRKKRPDQADRPVAEVAVDQIELQELHRHPGEGREDARTLSMAKTLASGCTGVAVKFIEIVGNVGVRIVIHQVP